MKKELKYILILLFLGILITFYIRGVVYKDLTFSPSDETAYEYFIFQDKHLLLPDVIVTGYGYVILGELFEHILPENVFFSAIRLIAVITSAIFLVVLFFIYSIALKNKFQAFFCCITLLLTNHFMFPMIEGKPEQIGLLMSILAIVLFNKYILENKGATNKHKIVISLLMAGTFLMHFLSFVLTVIIILILLLINTSKKKNVGLGTISWFYGTIFLIMIYFINENYSVYKYLKWGIIQAVTNTLEKVIWKNLIWLITVNFIICILPFIVLFFINWGILNKKLNLPYKEKIAKNISSLLNKNRKKIFFLSIMTFVLILTIQLIINPYYTKDYYGSVSLFVLFFIPNLIFGLSYLYGVIVFNQKKAKVFLVSSIIILLMAVSSMIVLLISKFYIPTVMYYQNILIRNINYFTIFSAPIASFILFKTFLRFKKILQIVTIIFVLLLISISIINTSLEPSIFNTPRTFWTLNEKKAADWLANNQKSPLYHSVRKNMDGAQYIFGLRKSQCKDCEYPLELLQPSKENKIFVSGSTIFYSP